MFARLVKAPFIWIGRTFFDTLIRSGVTPNQVTLAGFAMVLVHCGAYLWHRDMFVLGVGLSLTYPFDALDGAIARRRNMSTKFGGYLDAVIDRYQEAAGYFVVGYVTGWWLEVFLLTTGCMLISYNKAAAAVHAPVDNKGWPDLMERARRTWLFCAALILENAVPVPAMLGGSFVRFTLCCLVALVHFTAIQRVIRAKRLLQVEDEIAAGVAGKPSPAGLSL